MHPFQRWHAADCLIEAHGGMKTQATEMATPAAPAAGIKRVCDWGQATFLDCVNHVWSAFRALACPFFRAVVGFADWRWPRSSSPGFH